MLRALLLAAALIALPAGRALASTSQQAMFEDDARMLADPVGTLAQLRMLGVQRVRLPIHWDYIAPDPGAAHPPRNFNAADPAAYPAANWTTLDAIVTDAQQQGITLDANAGGGAPRWATGPGRPSGSTNPNWQPSASMYGAFVHALAVRYSGSYDPVLNRTVRDANDLPRVSFWSVWNEPDYGPSLAPQGVPGDLTVENSPRVYRNLVDAAWSALQQTGHRGDTFIWGELAPRDTGSRWGVFAGMAPLVFLRAMFCVDSSYRPLQGAAAAIRGCPPTAAGSRRFRAQNPALFNATGVSDHPYMRWYPPNLEEDPSPDFTSLGQIGNLEHALDRLQRVYGSRMRYPIWNTEFGYITSPPKHSPDPTSKTPEYYVSAATAAYYLNWAEYISWRDPRIASFFQYLLSDPLRSNAGDDWGGFASGLQTFSLNPKATYDAWRLPLYMPVTHARHGHALEVWGCVRPARFAILDTGPAAGRRDPVPGRLAGRVQDDPDRDAHQPGNELLLRRAYRLPEQRIGPSGVALPHARFAARVHRPAPTADRLQPQHPGHGQLNIGDTSAGWTPAPNSWPAWRRSAARSRC